MEDRWRQRGGWGLLLLFFLLLIGLTVVAGLSAGELWQLFVLSSLILIVGAGFAGLVFQLAGVAPPRGPGPLDRPVDSPAVPPPDEATRQRCQDQLEQAHEQILRLTTDLRQKADQLTADRDRAEFLRQSFSELASSLEPRRVLSEILQRATQVVGASRGSIFLLDERGQPSELFLAQMGGKVSISPRTRAILNKGLAGWVVRNRRGDLIYDTAQDERWLDFPGDAPQRTRSAAAVPIQLRDRVLGVIVLSHAFPFHFRETHLTLLQDLARQAAICLENADLYTIAEEERRKLAAILSGTTDAVIVVDRAGRLLLLNQAAARAFQVEEGDILGRPLDRAIDHQGLRALFSQARSSNEPVIEELSTADGRVRYGSLSPVPGVGWVAILQDITYLKRLDRMKSEFVATVSHDLRSPLTTVRGYADMVAILGPVSKGQRDALDKVRQAVEQMNELIEDLLDLGKIEAGVDMQTAPCDMEVVVNEMVERLLPRAELKGHDLRIEVDGAIPPVMGDAGRLRQVVGNLVDNAIKYTPPGGAIQVRIFRRDGQVVVAVSDNGLGISPRDQEQLFQRFYRVRRPEMGGISGTGLGLAIARSIVERHGGQIWVESALDQGSTFAFALPIEERGGEPAE